MKKIKAGLIGGAGYVGGEMIRLLLNHEMCDIKYIYSSSQVGKRVYTIHKDLRGWIDLSFSDTFDSEIDVVFICKGHGKSKEFLSQNTINSSTLIIDLSRDYRLIRDSEDFIYGLCELNKEEIKSSLKIANPGCFATCIQLGLLPLAANALLNSEVHITAITGSTGAGQNPLPTTHNSWRNNNISIYKAFTHQHLDEITQSIRQLQPDFSNEINFIPMRGSFTRGIFASIYLESSENLNTVIDHFQEYYEDSPFVHITDQPISVKDVVNTNNALLYVSKHKNKIRIESCIDNLLKGASGQAIQNMNLAMGWSEQAGLKLKASAF